MAWIDELAPGQRKPGHGPVPEELKRKAVVTVASGRLKSREAAAELGVEVSVVGKLETTDARRIRGDARDGDTRGGSPRRPGRGKPAWRLWRRETCRRPHPGLGRRRIRRTR